MFFIHIPFIFSHFCFLYSFLSFIPFTFLLLCHSFIFCHPFISNHFYFLVFFNFFYFIFLLLLIILLFLFILGSHSSFFYFLSYFYFSLFYMSFLIFFFIFPHSRFSLLSLIFEVDKTTRLLVEYLVEILPFFMTSNFSWDTKTLLCLILNSLMFCWNDGSLLFLFMATKQAGTMPPIQQGHGTDSCVQNKECKLTLTYAGSVTRSSTQFLADQILQTRMNGTLLRVVSATYNNPGCCHYC